MPEKFQIIVEFSSKRVMEEFCAQMSDGFGEGFCDFSFYRQIEGTDGTKQEHYEKVEDAEGRRIYFVDSIFEQ